MEGKVGEIYDDGVVKLKVVEAYGAWKCVGCYFLECDRTAREFQNCLKCEREDGKSVIFQIV